MPLLITGICGFAGSTIARGLLAHQPDLQIIGLDSLIRKIVEAWQSRLKQKTV
jgi:CDP-paratose 2-epimerase